MWGGFKGVDAKASNRAAGLPFGGIPSELSERTEKILAKEPARVTPSFEFSQVIADHTPFSFRSFLGPQRFALMAAFLMVILETATGQVGPLLTGLAIDHGVRAKNLDVLALILLIYMISILVNGITNWGRISFTGRFSARMMLALRIRVFSHLQRLSLDFYTGEKTGRLMTRMTSDIEALMALFQEGIVQLAVQGLQLIIITIILFVLNPTLAAFTLIVVLPVMGVLTYWFHGASDKGYTLVRDRIADVLADLSESLAGIRIISAHNRRRHNVIQHNNVVGEYYDANMYTARIGAIYGATTETVGIIGRALLILVGGGMVFAGKLEVGELVTFVLFLVSFFSPIQQLVGLYNQFQSGQAAVAKLRGLLSTPPSVAESPDAVEMPPLEGEIILDHVSFGYTPDTPVLRDVNLHIAAGETFSLVGPTGAGKSTVAKLITRFYDPTAGRVSIDGHDLKDVTHHSLRSQLGVVPQEAFLFHGSIRDNVAFARPDATEEEIMDACRTVGIDDLIDRLPLGLDTPCHERGVSLSSGERQLIALARAFLSRPRVLILDEATSNLDLRSESKIERALDVLLEGRTAVIIAHRLATAMRGDRIAVVDEGSIVELGTHDELVARNGKYAEMYATYLNHMEGGSGSGAD
ncbi:MAG: ABC transporter ATP-binding protein [Desulfobacterales bacterium]